MGSRSAVEVIWISNRAVDHSFMSVQRMQSAGMTKLLYTNCSNCSILQSQRTIPGFVWREGARFRMFSPCKWTHCLHFITACIFMSMAGDSHASAQPLRSCPAKSSPARVQATASGCRSTRGWVRLNFMVPIMINNVMWWFVIMIWDMTCFYVLLASHSGIKSCQSCSRHYKTHEPWSKGLVFLKALREWLRRSLRAAYAPTVWVYAQNSLTFCLRGIVSRISLTKNSFERGSHWHHRQSHYTYITNTNDTHVINVHRLQQIHAFVLRLTKPPSLVSVWAGSQPATEQLDLLSTMRGMWFEHVRIDIHSMATKGTNPELAAANSAMYILYFFLTTKILVPL